MARRTKQEHIRKWQIIRYIAVCFAWATWMFIVLSCVSYHPHDAMYVRIPFAQRNLFAMGNPNSFYAQPVCHNICGPEGAVVAHALMRNIGPGVFVGLVMLAGAMVAWTRGHLLKQWGMQLAGTLILMGVTSAFFYLAGTAGNLSGGKLGLNIAEFLEGHFKLAGAFLILGFSLVVGLLLVADEFMLAVPGWLMATWQRMPRRQMAGAAAGAVGGLWGNIREFVGHMGKRPAMGRPAGEKRLRKGVENGGVEAPFSPALACPPETGNEARGAEATATATAVAEAPVAEAEVPGPEAPTEPVIRKPVAPKSTFVPFKPAPPQKQDLGNYRLPGLDLLDEAEPINPEGQEQRVREKARVLEAALESFGIDGKVEAIDTGPVVTLFELGLAPGVKSSQVAALSKDIARALKSPPVRIIDNIPGKSTMGIEVPNLDRERVRLKELMQLGHDQIERMALPMCLGKDASGNPLIEDLTKMPHMLIAGTTGSGKSVCINSIIMTLLLTQRPDHVKLIMVDPKMVEMQDYKTIPHLMAPIIDDMGKAESILEWATQKMDERYETLAEVNMRHIKDFNKLSREEIIERTGATTEDDKAKLCFHMPYIVIIIDELADLMMTSKDVEGHIVRIAQKARAVGIHLILATQRPEAQVVTGLIKSNMPGRICFQVRSRLDSRIMLDQSGGELLLGQGDLLMLKPTGGGMVRGQGAFVDDPEIKRVSKFLREIAEPEFHPELMQLGQAAGLGDEEKDALYNDAVDIMIETGRGSVSLIQRRLNIGYSRASRLIDQMRRTGIVGAYKGSMASEVTITKEQWEEMKAAEAAEGKRPLGGDGEEGSTGGRSGAGGTAGYAQQVNSTFDPDEDDDGVPDEMPGEHRM